MNKILFKKSLIKLTYFLFFAFFGPITIYQAFKNKDHILYIPVLIIGLILFFLAIFNGFRGIKILVNSFLGQKKKQ
jgi:polyferredoxin